MVWIPGIGNATGSSGGSSSGGSGSQGPPGPQGIQGDPGADGQDAVNNLVTATVDFGFASGGESGYTTQSVSAAWVTANSRILCQLADDTTATHDRGDGILEGIQAFASDIDPGVGFTLHARALNGTFGQYKINCFGVEA